MADALPVPDPFLQTLIKGADRAERDSDRIGSSITIIVGGSVISGAIIGEAQYFHQIGSGFAKESRGDPDLERVPKFFEQTSIDRAAATADENYAPTFLHLRDVQLAGGPGVIKAIDFMLRVRLSDVQAFGFGALAAHR